MSDLRADQLRTDFSTPTDTDESFPGVEVSMPCRVNHFDAELLIPNPTPNPIESFPKPPTYG